MSLKDKVVSWQAGVECALAEKFEDAVDKFTEIPEPSARIFFNVASAFLRLGNLEDAERVRKKERLLQSRARFSLFFLPPYRILICACKETLTWRWVSSRGAVYVSRSRGECLNLFH